MPLPSEPAAAPLDLHTLVSHFVALRHEVNLQTKSARAQQEQNAETLDRLGQALATLQQSQAAGTQSRQAELQAQQRPLLKTLLDLHDALSLAVREAPRLQDTVKPLLLILASDPTPPGLLVLPPPLEKLRAWWSRWIDRGKAERKTEAEHQRQCLAQEARKRSIQEAGQRIQQLLASFLAGYTMSLQRVERALHQHGLEPIVCVGQPFDPELMEVVEAVADSSWPSGQVLEEFRRGYLWQGRVFRFAQVKVAK